MPNDLPRGFQTVSLDTQRKHNRLCEQFRHAWSDGQEPQLEEWLAKVPEAERPALFCVLAREEIDLRGGNVAPAELQQRFPAFSAWIESVFRDATDYDFDAANRENIPLPAIPGYLVLSRIAVGGMGVVYKAMQVDLDRLVALKMVRGGRWCKEDNLARFKIEARAVAELDHPHIVRIHDFGEFEGLPFFTMEYVDGGSLAQRLINEPFGFREAAALLESIARAVQVVHDRKLIHRDLKPGNILLSKSGAPKISDFGLAKRLGSDLQVTVTGTIMGTASYMAPEQARGDKHVSHAVDIYALGAILYECLTGQPPFRAENYEQTVRRVTDEDPQRPRDLIGAIPPELEAICLKCLEKDPAHRYLRAVDLADDLRRFLDGRPLSIGAFDVVDQHIRWARRLGYDHLDLLGCTPWAFVYLARESSINRQVVLKIGNGTSGSPAHQRLLRQAVAMADLDHPNVERLYFYGEYHQQPYLVQEFVEGRSLSTVMRERSEAEIGEAGHTSVGDQDKAEEFVVPNDPSAEVAMSRLPARKAFTPISAPLAAEWVRMLARALQFIHEHGVLHGAIYPGEIRLTRDGTPKLCGFGAAQKVDRTAGPHEAAATWMRPNYQSPEQVSGDWKSLSPASDIYSLGTVLYELLTGQAPFFGMGMPETRAAVAAEIPRAPRNINAAIPPLLDAICQRCLAKVAGDRFASAKELADALDRYLREVTTTSEETATFDLGGAAAPAQAGDFELRIYHKGQKKAVVFTLPRGRITIGREPKTSDIVIQDEFCSREHCAVDWDDRSNQHVLILIRAKHGVRINEQSVRGSQVLVPGDVIRVPGEAVRAPTKIVFERKGAAM